MVPILRSDNEYRLGKARSKGRPTVETAVFELTTHFLVAGMEMNVWLRCSVIQPIQPDL